MDFFYHYPSITTQVSIEFTDNNESNTDFFDYVNIGLDISKELFTRRRSDLAVNIVPEPTHPAFPPTGLVCWVAPQDDNHGCTLRLPTTQPQDIDQSSSLNITCRISPISLLPLTKVVFSARNTKGYEFASDNPTLFRERLFSNSPILRNGFVYRLSSLQNDSDGRNASHEYSMIFSEPVAQGYLLPDTEISVSLSHDIRPNPHPLGRLEMDEYIEIDQTFMANSILNKIDPIPTSQECCFTLKTGARGNTGLLNDYTVLLRPSDLGKVGLISGDWATICAVDVQTQRLVKVVACQGPHQIQGEVIGDLSLPYNLGISPMGSGVSHVSITANQLGPLPPPLPLARSVTISWIMSPSNFNNVHGPSLLCGLRNYFQGTPRLVKRGDVLVIPSKIDSLTIHIKTTLRDTSHVSDDDFDHPTGVDLNHNLFFLVANVEYDVVPEQGTVNSNTYIGASGGAFGCWVDCEKTQILQTCNEQSGIPGYWDIRTGDRLRVIENDNYRRLYRTFQVALIHSASAYDLTASVLLLGPRGVGKSTMVKSIANRLGVHLFEVDCYSLVQENSTRTEDSLRDVFFRATDFSPCVLLLRHLEALMHIKQQLDPIQESRIAQVLKGCIDGLLQPWKLTGYPLIVVGTTSATQELPPDFFGCFRHEITVEPPDELLRAQIWGICLGDKLVTPDVDVSRLVIHTAGLLASDIGSLVERAASKSLERTFRVLHSLDLERTHAVSSNLRDTIGIHVPLSDDDLISALDHTRISYAEVIGAPKIPNVTWDDVGGLSSVKLDILDTVQLPLKHPELFADGLKKRSGILLYGPPGTGKTLLAKAVATTCSLNFLSVKGPELLNMYIGESEANVRRVFQRARAARPCVIFFDELDSVAPKRGNHGDSGGVMDRIVSQLLSELDGMSVGPGSTDVFIIGATNRPDLLDPALLRPGRFDRALYLGVPDSNEAQVNIVSALTRKFRLHPALSLPEVVSNCPFHFTGADFYALCSDAILIAMSRQAEEVDKRITLLNQQQSSNQPFHITPYYYLFEIASERDVEVLVTQEDFHSALSQLKPSVTESELEHYKYIQKSFSSDVLSRMHAN